MPLGVLVTLANPGAIASSHLFRRFESRVSSSSSSNSGDGGSSSSGSSDGRSNYFDDSGGSCSSSSSSSIEEWYKNQVNRPFERVPLDDDEKSSLRDDYSLLYGLNIKSIHRRIRRNSGSSKNNNSDNNNGDKVSNTRVGNQTIRRSNNAFADVDYINNNRRLNYGDSGSDRDDSSSSPFDIINKPLIFSIPGL